VSSKVRFFAVAVWLALGPAWAVAQSEKPASSPERFVFVPYEKTTGPQIGKQQSVLLPYAEFLRLKSAAEKRPLAAEFKPLAPSLAFAIALPRPSRRRPGAPGRGIRH